MDCSILGSVYCMCNKVEQHLVCVFVKVNPNSFKEVFLNADVLEMK